MQMSYDVGLALNSHGKLPYRHAHIICGFNTNSVNVSVDSVYVCVCARAHVWLSILVQVSNTRFDIHTNLGQSFVTSIVEETREGENAKKHYIS